jgi:Helix-turn-helix domain
MTRRSDPITIREAAERLGVTRQRVHQLLRSCGIHPQESGFGTALYITESDLATLLKTRTAPWGQRSGA